MAGKGDILAGKAVVALGLKDNLTTQLKTAMGSFRAGLSSMATALAGPAAVGTAAFAAVTAAVTNYVSEGSAINDMSMRTGASAEQLQTWTFAAKQSGASAEDLEKALKKMSKNGLPPGEFERVGREIAGIQDPAERSARAMEMFGKSGTKLIPMFTDLNELTASSKALGPILSEDQVKAADALGDAFGALIESLKRMSQQFAATLGPHLIGPLQTAIGMVTAFSEMMSGKGTTFSGDLLDRFSQFSAMTADEFKGRGAAATNGFSKGRGPDMGGEDGAPGESKATSGLATQDQIIKSIIAGQRARFNLANQFATAEERHAQKMNELNQALIAVNRNRVLGMISPEEAAVEKQMLTVAMQRADAAERERRAKLVGKPEKQVAVNAELPEAFKPTFQTTSVNSAGAAMAMQSSSGGAKDVVKELREIRKVSIDFHRQALAKLGGPKAV